MTISVLVFRWIHIECDKSLENNEANLVKGCYICIACKETGSEENVQSCENKVDDCIAEPEAGKDIKNNLKYIKNMLHKAHWSIDF